MIKIIYFDFGAVLVNYEKAFTKICADFNLDFHDFWKFYDKFDYDLSCGKITSNEFWQKCIENYHLQSPENFELSRWWVVDYEIIKPINDLIYSLENKIDIGIISNICDGPWQAALKYGKVPDIKYKKIYLSYQEKMAKPDKDIYEKVQKESGVLPNEILFVDDRAENLIVPEKLGWQTVLFDMHKAEDGVARIKEILL
jgi:putative hydrolase of the HAD superfamily